eukprot:COSAG02_NODE_1283_length_13471_cov_12.121223_7_plen_88_part_00
MTKYQIEDGARHSQESVWRRICNSCLILKFPFTSYEHKVTVKLARNMYTSTVMAGTSIRTLLQLLGQIDSARGPPRGGARGGMQSGH